MVNFRLPSAGGQDLARHPLEVGGTMGLVEACSLARPCARRSVSESRGVNGLSEERTAVAQQAIVVNGAPLETTARTLAELLSELGFSSTRVATAHNGEFVAAGVRAKIAIAAGDRVEILSARQGG